MSKTVYQMLTLQDDVYPGDTCNSRCATIFSSHLVALIVWCGNVFEINNHHKIFEENNVQIVQLQPTYLVSLCFHEQVGDTIVDGWSQFECNFNVFADMILPYGSHCIDMTASSEPINGVSGTWLSCFATSDWLRAFVHLHCDVMITTSAIKTWWSCRSLGSTCHAYGRKFAIKIQCWWDEKYVNLKMKT